MILPLLGAEKNLLNIVNKNKFVNVSATFIFTYDLEEFTFSKWQDKQVDSKFDEEKINSIVENNGKYVLLSFENYKNAVKFENKGILSIKYVTTIDVLTDEKYVLVELH